MGWRRWWRSIQRRVRPGRGRRKHEVNCQEEARSCQAKEYQKTQRGCCQRKEQRLLALLLPESESKENGDGDRCPGRRGHLQLHGHSRPEILHRLLIESICNIEICILQFNCILVILSTCIKIFLSQINLMLNSRSIHMLSCSLLAVSHSVAIMQSQSRNSLIEIPLEALDSFVA